MKLLLTKPSTTTGTTACKKRSLLFDHLSSLMATIQIVSPITVSSSNSIPNPDNSNQNSVFPLSNCDTILISNNLIVSAIKTDPSSPQPQALELTFSSTQCVKLPPFYTISKPPTSLTTLTFLWRSLHIRQKSRPSFHFQNLSFREQYLIPGWQPISLLLFLFSAWSLSEESLVEFRFTFSASTLHSPTTSTTSIFWPHLHFNQWT